MENRPDKKASGLIWLRFITLEPLRSIQENLYFLSAFFLPVGR